MEHVILQSSDILHQQIAKAIGDTHLAQLPLEAPSCAFRIA